MNARFSRRRFRRRLELGDSLGVPSQAVESFTVQDVCRSGIRIGLQHLVKLVLGAVKLLGPQAALRQHLLQFGIGGVRFGHRLQGLRR